jgi:hypothetical protein
MKQLFALYSAVALFGWGCDRLPGLPTTEPEPTSPFSQLSPKEAADKIQFLPNDTFEVRQTVLGLGASLPDLTGSSTGVRYVKIDRFAPMNTADLSWTSVIERLAPPKDGATSSQPIVEKTNQAGSVTYIDLKNSHSLLLPVYWQAKEMRVTHDKSVVWLAEDAYRELSRTGKTVLNMGVVDEAANTIVKNLKELKSAWAKLRNQAVTEEKAADLTILEAEKDRIEWPLRINGIEKKVSAIKAKSWFGELVILDSQQNPLVLKLTLNPALVGADIAGKQGLKSLFGYEITNLMVQAVK